MTLPSDEHPARLDPDHLLGQCEVTRSRGSGPGGQHRNKVETRVVLRHRATGITAEAGERRSQRENLQVALFRLRVKLAVQYRTAITRPYTPSALWQSRCRGKKVEINPKHIDFPALLAEVLDLIAECDWDVRQAAGELKCSSTQLVKLLKIEPAALKRVNDQRTERGQRPLS